MELRRFWTAEEDRTLKRLYLSGGVNLFASEIAAKMGGGLTRNAIIGRVHRLGLPLRGPTRRITTAKPAKPKPERIAPLRIVWANGTSDKLRAIETPSIECQPSRIADVEPRNIPFSGLAPNDCRYPYGEGAEMVFCAHPKTDGSSYCSAHRKLVVRRTRNNDEAVTEARAKRMRGINFRRALLESLA